MRFSLSFVYESITLIGLYMLPLVVYLIHTNFFFFSNSMANTVDDFVITAWSCQLNGDGIKPA